MRNSAASSEEDTDRRIGGIVRVGRVESVDDAGSAIVSFGEEQTPPIDWIMSTGDVQIWLRPTVGQQVLVAAPDGDVEQSSIIGALPTEAMPALKLGASVAIRFKDGALITYDPEAKHLNFDLPGTALVTAPNGAKIDADVEITKDVKIGGKLDVTGDIKTPGTVTGDTDVVAAGKSGKGHKHPAGSPLTGTPQ
ncbi:MAG: phage baseplate assembly protein V [Caulobacteraceae bacterium]|nr:MAG: phage baseplate assembly protein V [Caulobacteraceae bacterium]